MLASLLAAGAFALASTARAEQQPTVEWNDDQYRRIRWPEGVASLALVGGAVAIDQLPYPDHVGWRGPILFDDGARDLLRARDPRASHLASVWSDNLFYGMAVAPFVIDNYLVALGVHQSTDVSMQLTLIDLQAFGFAGVITLGTEHLVARARPPFSDCSGLDSTDPRCNLRDDYRSFYAGHPAATFTAAGLTCAHHQHLPLYGGGAADVVPCVVMVGLATTTSMLRIVADRHWSSDVLVGVAVGIGSGYFLPSILHYGMFGTKKVDTTVHTSCCSFTPTPLVFMKGGGLGVAAVF